MTHPFHPLYGQQFEILNYRHSWGEYRVTFYETPDQVRILPAAWTSLAPPDPSVVLAAGRAVFRVADLLALAQLLQRSVTLCAKWHCSFGWLALLPCIPVGNTHPFSIPRA